MNRRSGNQIAGEDGMPTPDPPLRGGTALRAQPMPTRPSVQ